MDEFCQPKKPINLRHSAPNEMHLMEELCQSCGVCGMDAKAIIKPDTTPYQLLLGSQTEGSMGRKEK
jgi:hypothetical protein